jgi:hypothetical protein
MAGGLVIALPLYYWRLHNTEITEDDFVEPTLTEGQAEEMKMGETKADPKTMVSEKLSK